MTTDTSSQQTGVISVDEKKEKEPHKREIPKLFYSKVTWKLASSKKLDEKEINEVILRIAESYSQFLKDREKELASFGYELEISQEPKEKDSSEFRLEVQLIAPTYIPTESFAPPSIQLPLDHETPGHESLGQPGHEPLDQLSPDTVNITHMSSKTNTTTTNNNSGTKPPPATVEPTLQNITVKANDSVPTQNTGGQTPPPTKG